MLQLGESVNDIGITLINDTIYSGVVSKKSITCYTLHTLHVLSRVIIP